MFEEKISIARSDLARVRLLDKAKLGVYKKLSKDFETRITSDDFNNAFLFLDDVRSVSKVIPYRLFDEEVVRGICVGDCAFGLWLRKSTENIEKEFNKGRKVMRLLKDITHHYGSVLPFSLPSESVFLSMLEVFIVKDSYVEVNSIDNKTQETIELVRGYLESLLYSDIVLKDRNLREDFIYEMLSVDTRGSVTVAVEFAKKNL